MKFNMTKIAAALALTVTATGAQAVVANTFEFIGGGATVAAGTAPPATGSWFSMLAADTDDDMIPDSNVYTQIRGAGTTGIPGANGMLDMDVPETLNMSAAIPSENNIDRNWSFFSAQGAHYTDQALEVTWDGVSNTATVNMAGWAVYWNGGSIDMGTGADAIINLGGDGLGGGNDTLSYSAVVPTGSFTGVQYGLYMVGNATLAPTLAPIPEASTYGMMLAGLGLVGFAVRRRKSI